MKYFLHHPIPNPSLQYEGKGIGQKISPSGEGEIPQLRERGWCIVLRLFFLCFFFLLSYTQIFAEKILVENIFSDIDVNYVYRDELQLLYDRGMIIPDSSGKFSPDKLLNRDEFVGISMEVICERCIQPHTDYELIDTYNAQKVYFDITKKNPYFYCVASAKENEYVRGYDIGESCQDGSSQEGERPFCPVNRIRLEEAVAVLLRNSGIFTIENNRQVVADIYAGKIANTLGNDVSPTDELGNPYTFYGYLQKALDFEITEYDTQGNEKTLKLLEVDENGGINPQRLITKQEFLKMAYIALKSNNCSEPEGNQLALTLEIYDEVCEEGQVCPRSDLDNPDNIYDLEGQAEGYCERGIDESTGYIWRFHHSGTGEQVIRYGKYVDDYEFLNSGEWKVFLRAIDLCGNTSEAFSTIFVGDRKSVKQEIDVDIDMYEDECFFGKPCRETHSFGDHSDSDDIFDFRGSVETTCFIGGVSHSWIFTHETGKKREYNSEYLDNIRLSPSGIWTIELSSRDGCGQTGSETLTLKIPESDDQSYIDADILVYDASCSEGERCTNRYFAHQDRELKDHVYDFGGDLETSCDKVGTQYRWVFEHESGNNTQEYTGRYLENIDLSVSGVWKITLNIQDECGQRHREKMNFIIPGDIVSGLSASMKTVPIFGPEDLEVVFEGFGYGGEKPYVYNWSFGDGTGNYGKTPLHLYDRPGVYDVRLELIDARGKRAYATNIVVVTEDRVCDQDSDKDGINDCDDLCPEVPGESGNKGCPIHESECGPDCSCPAGYTCSDKDPNSCSNGGRCIPDFTLPSGCLYQGDHGNIFGSNVCTSCPCNSSFDFRAQMRKCDYIFPAITSPDMQEIYSRGQLWQIQ